MADTDEFNNILPNDSFPPGGLAQAPLPSGIGGETQFWPMAGNVLGPSPGSLAAPPPPSVAERTREAQEKLLGLLGGLPNAAAADLAASRAAAASQAAARGQLAERYKVAAEAPLPDLYKPQYRPVPEAPKPVYREPFQALGAPLAALALVAGAFTRNSGTAVLTAASTAMEAQAKGDQAGYENARSEFKDALDTTMKNNEMERNAYRDAWSDRKATFDERVSNLALWSSYYQNKAMSSAASGGNVAQINAQIAGLTSTLGVLKQMEPAYKSVSEAKGAVLSQFFAKYPDDIPRAIREAAPLLKEITDAETKAGSGGPTAASQKSETMQALVQQEIANGVDPVQARINAEEKYRRLEAIGGAKPVTGKAVTFEALNRQFLDEGKNPSEAASLALAEVAKLSSTSRVLGKGEANIQAEMENLKMNPANANMTDSQIRTMANDNVNRGAKSVLSEVAFNRLEQVAILTEESLDKADLIIDLLNRGEKAGLLGKGYRFAEVIGNVLGTSSTEAAQVRGAVQYLRQTYGQIMQTGGQRLKMEASRIDDIIKGLEAGSTTVNTLQSIKDYQEMLVDYLKMNIEQRRRARPNVSTELPKGGSPPAASAAQGNPFDAFPKATK